MMPPRVILYARNDPRIAVTYVLPRRTRINYFADISTTAAIETSVAIRTQSENRPEDELRHDPTLYICPYGQ